MGRITARPRSLKSKNPSPKNTDGTRKTLRVLLIDSCLVFRDGLFSSLSQSTTLKVERRLCSAQELFDRGAKLAADIALVDIDLPDLSGIEVGQRLLSMDHKMKVVLLSYVDWDIYLLAAQTIQSCGLLLRNQPTADLVAALEKAASGPIWTLEQVKRIQAWKKTTGSLLRSLRQREWQVLRLVGLGRTNREIAEDLSVSENTVEKHISSILQKLNLTSRATIVVFLYTNHIDALNRISHLDRFLALLVA
jgi:DNA-binding NarL/FixJ family response regulator